MFADNGSKRDMSSFDKLSENSSIPSIDLTQSFNLRISSDAMSQEENTQPRCFKGLPLSKPPTKYDVIVISDSSESGSPAKMKPRKWNSGQPTYEESSSSDESNSDVESSMTYGKQTESTSKMNNPFKTARRIGVTYGSDETIGSTKSNSSKNSFDSHVSGSPPKNLRDQFHTYRDPKPLYFLETGSNIATRKYKGNASKVTRPKRPGYFTDMKKATESTDSRADTRGSGSSEDRGSSKISKAPVIINETLSDTDQVLGTPPKKPEKPPSEVEGKSPEQDPKSLHVELSEGKRDRIAAWLVDNTPDARGSYSSVVSESNRGLSSGNSSLERFEMDNETPNNRDRIRKPMLNKVTPYPERVEENRPTVLGR